MNAKPQAKLAFRPMAHGHSALGPRSTRARRQTRSARIAHSDFWRRCRVRPVESANDSAQATDHRQVTSDKGIRHAHRPEVRPRPLHLPGSHRPKLLQPFLRTRRYERSAARGDEMRLRPSRLRRPRRKIANAIPAGASGSAGPSDQARPHSDRERGVGLAAMVGLVVENMRWNFTDRLAVWRAVQCRVVERFFVEKCDFVLAS
jgi:hypothetical protein